MDEARVFASVVRPLVGFAESLGLSVDEILAHAGITVEAEDPDALVPYEALIVLWQALVAAHPTQPLGLMYGSLLPLEATGVIGYALRHVANGHAAVALTLRFSRLIDPFLRLEVVRDGEWSIVKLEHEPRTVALVEPVEMLVVAMLRMAVGLVGQGAHAREVRFRHEARHPLPTYRQAALGADVRFGAECDGIVFSSALLDLPMPAAEPRVAAYLEKHAATLIAAVGDGSLEDRIRTLVHESLSNGEPDIETVARNLGRSARSLQRELKERGSSFSGLVDEVRRDQAMALLRHPETGVAEVAFLLGYSDARAFYRSFRRWTGQTPSAFRRAK